MCDNNIREYKKNDGKNKPNINYSIKEIQLKNNRRISTPRCRGESEYSINVDNPNDIEEISNKIEKEISVLKNLFKLIDEKKINLKRSKNILELKYNKYKKCHNFWNISTIVLSSILTLIESSKLVFIDDTVIHDDLSHKFFQLSPILLGTFITGTASVIKFKKYQEQMEEIYIVIDKCIAMISKLKNKRDEIIMLRHKEKQINICDNNENETIQFQKDVQTLNTTFKNDIIKEFGNVYVETEKYINYNDYEKFLKKINDIEYKKHVLRIDEQKFFDEYDHDIEKCRMIDIKKETIDNHKDRSKNCCGF